ncbi:pyridoxal phosphate-dependent aminotransferase [Candidatus Peregrinibacteria bacterium]|nr:pyridoxal phosphate-dependent aminotransferase [Candidatus Peregrinibacteria bacterium]
MTRSALERAGIKSRTDGIADRARRIVVSPIKEIAILAAEIPDVIPFAWGIPFVDTPPHIREALKKALDEDHLLGRYSPSAGLPVLKQALAARLAKKFGIEVNWKTELLVTAGAMEGLMDAMQCTINPGDEVIITSPGFSSYTEQVMLAGGVPKYLPLDENKDWAMRLEELPKLITPKTRAIIINSPCNPTGSIFSQQELDAIADAVLKHNLILITDEPYDFLLFDGTKLSTLVADDRLRKNRISCFSFSKEYAMTGYRVGYVFAEEGMIRQMMKVHDAFIVSAPRPSQVAALAAINGPQACVEELRKTLQDRRDRLCSHLDRMKKWFSYVKPRGTYYCFVKFQDGSADDVQLALDILNGAHISVVPGSAFGPEGKGHLRICFGCTIPEIDEGMGRLENWLKKAYP